MADNTKINTQLLLILKELINNNPELRFSQILYNYGFTITCYQDSLMPDIPVWKDDYYLESKELLTRVELLL